MQSSDNVSGAGIFVNLFDPPPGNTNPFQETIEISLFDSLDWAVTPLRSGTVEHNIPAAGKWFRVIWDSAFPVVVPGTELYLVFASLTSTGQTGFSTGAGAGGNPYDRGKAFIGSSFNDNFDSTFATYSTVVPVPAAVWLFGTALIGFIGFSRRRTNV